MLNIISSDLKSWTEDQVSRVKTVTIPIRTLVAWLYGHHQPGLVTIPDMGLPEGYVVLHAGFARGGMFIEAIVSHPSFEPVGECEIPPRWDGQMNLRMYALATEEELKSRKEGGWTPAPPVQTWRDKGPLL